RRVGRENALRIACVQYLYGLLKSRADQSATMAEALAADLERIGDVSEIESGITPQVLDQVGSRALQRRGSLGREHHKLAGPRRTRVPRRRGFFQHNVCVGPTDAKRADTRAAWPPFGPPLGAL